MPEIENPYELRPESVEAPPRTLAEIARRIGPGLILASTVVGSGELIATTVLGAENGYGLLWLILVSCGIKVAVQHELGRYAIATGETTLEALNRIPGPRLRVSWAVWMWLFVVLATLFPWGGMAGGIGEVLHRMVPSVPVNAWAWLVAVASVGLLVRGRYAFVERVSFGMVVVFTLLTIGCMAILFDKPEYFSWGEVLNGLRFRPPEGGMATAVTVFGLTGVGALELIIYPYWCLEKGYARFTGPRDGSAAWLRRARGWIRVMGLDVVNSMAVYSVATVAFYLLGAGVLRGMGTVPEGAGMVAMLSAMYTETLGGWALYPFLAGAVAVFYSTLFAGVAAFSRKTADFLGLLGLYDKGRYADRLKVRNASVVFFLLVPPALFFFVQEPVLMVKIGGVVQGLSLPVLAFATVYLRHKRLPEAVAPGRWITAALWITSSIMLVMTVYSVAREFLS